MSQMLFRKNFVMVIVLYGELILIKLYTNVKRHTNVNCDNIKDK